MRVVCERAATRKSTLRIDEATIGRSDRGIALRLSTGLISKRSTALPVYLKGCGRWPVFSLKCTQREVVVQIIANLDKIPACTTDHGTGAAQRLSRTACDC